METRATTMHTLHPIENFAEPEVHFLKVEENLPDDKAHTLHIRYFKSKNPDAPTVIYLHGGPGAGSDMTQAQLFNPEDYNIILLDQRGAGKSTPKGEMRENNTENLIEDLEKIRELFGLEKWVVAGGSWGSTLGLGYAEKYPERVSVIIMRGVFFARAEDTVGFLNDDSRAAKAHPKEWKYFKEETNKLLKTAGLPFLPEKISGDLNDKNSPLYAIINSYYDLLQGEDKELAAQAAGVFTFWEKTVSFLQPNAEGLSWATDPDGINMGLTEVTYMKKDWFLKENQLVDDLRIIKEAGIPVFIVHGKHDLVCSPKCAQIVKDNLAPGQVTYFQSEAGHAGSEPDTINYLVQAAKLARPLVQKNENENKNETEEKGDEKKKSAHMKLSMMNKDKGLAKKLVNLDIEELSKQKKDVKNVPVRKLS